MTEPDRGRLGLFFGGLIALASAGIAVAGTPTLTREFARGEHRTVDDAPRAGGVPAE